MGKKAVISLIAAVSLYAMISPPAYAFNDPEAEPSGELKGVQQRRVELKKDLLLKEAQIGELDQKEQTETNELKKLDDEIALMNEKIRNTEEIIKLTHKVVADMEKEIAKLSERIEKRDIIIKNRLRSLQAQGGGLFYLDLLMGARSFSEFVDFATAVTTIIEADKEILRDHYEDQQLKIQQEEELHKKLTAYDQDLKDLESLKSELQQKMEEKQLLVQSLQKDKAQFESELMDMYEVYVNLTSQEIAILKESQTANIFIPNMKKGEMFILPTTGVLTSGFGPRWGTQHYGLDIADASEHTKVYAAAAGTVIRSYYSKGYGNCVMITHRINGKTYTTVYAHLESSVVETGQRVEQGQMIGYMGNTGFSTGKHLHFEIHEGPWNKEMSYSVDPRLYVEI